jgi:hypothetical protein
LLQLELESAALPLSAGGFGYPGMTDKGYYQHIIKRLALFGC